MPASEWALGFTVADAASVFARLLVFGAICRTYLPWRECYNTLAFTWTNGNFPFADRPCTKTDAEKTLS